MQSFNIHPGEIWTHLSVGTLKKHDAWAGWLGPGMTNTQNNEKEFQKHEKEIQPVRSESYTKAVEEFRLWMENTKGREDDFKNGRTPRKRLDPSKNMKDKTML